ncbi:iron-containing redox enzyme family protein [Pseudomonas sp. v388]|uniref:iron-containing redox enzyme family protein n=1 Tax=Pseudomonas sp. v388 TaxID=2479849 RepID=UPI000F7ADE53|nr:iron-containing redox enzyme family protein [Pseudomonas sp. v388]RRV10552.1 iron-containing redox enzyme family protein [Pseudomonas sp. v388]
MTSLRSVADCLISKPTQASDAVSIYHALLNRPQDVAFPVVQEFLNDQLMLATQHSDAAGLPDDLNNWAAWIEGNASQVASAYREYLDGRHAGCGRKFFTSKAHALYFLQHVAPTKLVDGAWLYDAVHHGGDWRYHPLIRTYLEELGDGDPALNHVVLYRKLLADHDCAPTELLDQEHHVQGAIQLALGHAGSDYLPEVLGYNLGYEQLPLHLLITAFELNELGIDPYYFTLHVTIDNASTGHAHKAVQAAIDLLPMDDSRGKFIARMRTGYLLNELGTGTRAVISSFELEHEVVAMLERKRSFGQHMHSDYCRLDGLTVNEWLSEPGQCRAFLAALEHKGWIKRHQDPADSRFWQLIDGPGAVMFGVFSGYEMQLLRDWIAGDWQPENQAKKANPFRAQFRRRATHVELPASTSGAISVERLTALLSPSLHSTPDGLNATRAFSRQLAEGSSIR